MDVVSRSDHEFDLPRGGVFTDRLVRKWVTTAKKEAMGSRRPPRISHRGSVLCLLENVRRDGCDNSDADYPIRRRSGADGVYIALQ